MFSVGNIIIFECILKCSTQLCSRERAAGKFNSVQCGVVAIDGWLNLGTKTADGAVAYKYKFYWN